MPLRLKALSFAVLAVPVLAPIPTSRSVGWQTASMETARASQSAVVLSPSHLLVTGGETPGTSIFGSAVNTTQIFNVKTNRWKYVGSMSTARVGQAAVRLPDGEILVAGGEDSDGAPLQSAEVFSPGSGKWSAAAPMPKPAAEQSAVILPSGLVLATGGVVAGHTSKQALLYDYHDDTWRFASPMLHPRAGHGSVLLPDGDVLVAGGSSSFAELYLPGLNRWEQAGRPGPRLFPAMVSVGRSHVLMAGGRVMTGGCLASALVYRRQAQWVSVPSMSVPRCAPLSTTLPNGRAIVGGGFGSRTWSSLQEFAPHGMRWLPFPSLPSGRAAGTLTYLNGAIVAAGGTVDGDEISTSAARQVGP